MLEGRVPSDYDRLCQQWSYDEDSFVGWRELRGALGGRNGWWFLDPRLLAGFDGGPMWCFGVDEEAKLCITPLGSAFEIYLADLDEELTLDQIGDVVAWLDANEPDDGLAPMLRQLFERGPEGGDSRRP